MARTIILAALLASAVACGDSSSTPTLPPTSSGPFTQTDLVVGTGNTANNGNRLTVSYTGWLYDTGRPNGQGNSFDSQSSFQFVIGTGAVIRGWDQGIVGMRVGGQRPRRSRNRRSHPRPGATFHPPPVGLLLGTIDLLLLCKKLSRPHAVFG